MKKEEIIQTLKDNPIKIIKCGDIEIPVEYLKQTTVNVDGDDYIRLQQENKILKENAENNDKVVDKVNWENQLLKKENKQLKEKLDCDLQWAFKYDKQVDNWNKLKEYIRETKFKEFEKSYGKRYGKTFTQAEIIVCNMILDKMQELEQGSDNNGQ